MLKVIKNKKDKTKIKPYFALRVGIGYGEHCDDTFTYRQLEIDDVKANKYKSLTEKDMDKMSWMEIQDISYCITEKDAEKLVKLFDSLWERKDEDGYEVTHVVLNDGPSRFWWQKQAAMTDEEYDWFSDFYNEYSWLFSPEIEHNWYGVSSVAICYYDENNEKHNVEIV